MMKEYIERGDDRDADQQQEAIEQEFPFQQKTGQQEIDVAIDQQHIRRQQGQQLNIEMGIIDLINTERDQGGEYIVR